MPCRVVRYTNVDRGFVTPLAVGIKSVQPKSRTGELYTPDIVLSHTINLYAVLHSLYSDCMVSWICYSKICAAAQVGRSPLEAQTSVRYTEEVQYSYR